MCIPHKIWGLGTCDCLKEPQNNEHEYLTSNSHSASPVSDNYNPDNSSIHSVRSLLEGRRNTFTVCLS